jgi:3,4-dihydroxy 2-butanone 4-phosphate synthase/GTP cyclohydrolase II
MTEKVLVENVVCARIPTIYGEFELCLYTNNIDNKEHLAIIRGEVEGKQDVLVRVHSECFTGDVLGSERCDCGEQLDHAMKSIAEEGTGVLVYMRQEGRGIGLLEKLRAYNLQDEGYDTVDANLILGHQADSRDYTVAAAILLDLRIRSIRLITNNPEKIEKLGELGVEVSGRVGTKPTLTPNNLKYIRTKVNRMNHLLDLPALRVNFDDREDKSD